MNNRGEATILVILLVSGAVWLAGFWIASTPFGDRQTVEDTVDVDNRPLDARVRRGRKHNGNTD